jgi:hypothetical protein
VSAQKHLESASSRYLGPPLYKTLQGTSLTAGQSPSKEVAQAHGFQRLLIGSRYDNIASRKTIFKLGARPITIDDVPDEGVLHELKNERIDMFVWDIAS